MATMVTLPKENTACCGITNSSFTKLFQRHESKAVDSSVQEVLAESLNELSVEEREYVLEDIHGVADSIEESPSFVEDHLNLLDEEIGKINRKGRFAYELAESMGYQFVHNKKFRLMFLRSEEFDVEKAARKMIEHFQVKLELFGKDKLVGDITFDDLSPGAQASLCCGSHQSFFKDRMGRIVMFINAEYSMADTFQNFFQARWYQLMVALEDEATQRRGINWVLVGNYKGECKSYSMRSLKLFMTAVPERPAVLHVCQNDARLTFLQPFLNQIGKSIQVRTRFHFGESFTELLYTLQSFGIHSDCIPLQHDGQPNTVAFLKWLENRKIIERRRRNFPKTVVSASIGIDVSSSHDGNIRPTDIMLGRGYKHEGNSVLDKAVDNEFDAYVKASSQFEKTCIILTTIKQVEESGARFFIRNEIGEWVIADDKAIQNSIGCRFRARIRRKRNARSTKQPSNDKTKISLQQKTQYQIEFLKQNQLQLQN